MKKTIICGGSGMIGTAICQVMHPEYDIEVWDIRQPKHHCYQTFRQVDLTDELEIERHGKVSADIYINCSFAKGLENHLHSYIYPTDHIIEQMPAGGKVVLFSSIYGKVIPRDIYGGTEVKKPQVWYGMAKAAIEYMVKYYAKEYPDLQINAIAPGGVKADYMDRQFIENYERDGGLCKPEEIALSTLRLLKIPAITGQVITVDHGWTL